MSHRLSKVHALALVALLTLATAGCKGGGKGAEGTGAASPEVSRQELIGAVNGLSGKPYRFVVAQGATEVSSGATDGKGATQFHANISDPSSGASITLDAARIESAAYLKVDFGALAGVVPVLGDLNRTWVRVDPKKLPPSFAKQLDSGLSTDLSKLSGSIVTAQKSGDTYTGTLDLSKTGAALLNPSALGKVSPSATALPFTAKVAGGLLTSLTVSGVEIAKKPTDVTITVTDVGTPVAIVKPKGAVNAPADLYTLLGAV